MLLSVKVVNPIEKNSIHILFIIFLHTRKNVKKYFRKECFSLTLILLSSKKAQTISACWNDEAVQKMHSNFLFILKIMTE